MSNSTPQLLFKLAHVLAHARLGHIQPHSCAGEMCTDVFGAGWGSFRIAHLSTGDRIGVELFQFKNQKNPEDNFEYWKTGVFHFCVQDPNVEELAERIVAAGGK
jgi:hypothetical protein